MLEEAIRLIFSHPRFAEEPELATYGGMLIVAVPSLSQWRCFTNSIVEGDAVHCGTSAGGGGRAEGDGAASVGLCSSLLRLISLALTITKAAACCPDISGPWSGISFELWKACSSAVHLFDLPQCMQADRGITALLLNPACCNIQRTMYAVALGGPSDQASLSENVVSSLLMLLQRCSDSMPPRLAADVLMAGPALSLLEQEAGRLPQGAVGSAAVLSSRQRAVGAADFDGLAAPVASYISNLMMSLASSVFKVPPFGSQQLGGMCAPHRIMAWSDMALDPGGCREGYSLQDGEPFFSAAFQSETAPDPATPELADESVAALSCILSSPTWDRVIGYNPTSATTSNDCLVHITSSLCCAASILELHPAVRQHSHLGSIVRGDASVNAAMLASVLAPPPSGSIGVTPPLSSQWREARYGITDALRLFNSPYSRAALVRVLSLALSRLREVLSGIVSQSAATADGGDSPAATGGDSLGATTAADVVAGQNRSSGSLGIRDWECVQSELLLGLPEELWGVRPCCNTACVRLDGPCEMEVKTRACGGRCGARYCCADCQEQAWRGGHRRNCAAMREMREGFKT